MKIELNELKKGLKVVMPAVAVRSTLPVLKHICVRVEDGKVTLDANNLEMAIRCTVPVTGGDDEAMTVPAKLLNDYVGTLGGDVVDVAIDPEKATLKMVSAQSEATIKGFPAEEFPGIAEVTGEDFTLSQTALEFLANRVLLAASNDEGRPVLTGVLTEFDGNIVRMVAADGFRLSLVEYTQDWGLPPEMRASALIPAKALAALGKLCAAYPDDTVKMTLGEDRVFFDVGDAVLTAQLLDETFPDYDQIIPKTHEVFVGLSDVTPFLQAVRMTGLFSFILALKIGDGKIVVKAVGEESGEGTAEVEAVTEGDIEIGLNEKFLTDYLKVAKGGQPVEMKMTTPTAPVLFTQGENFRHVIMPLHVTR